MTTINKNLKALPITLDQLSKYNSYLEYDQTFNQFYIEDLLSPFQVNYLPELISYDLTMNTYANINEYISESCLDSITEQEWQDYFRSIAKLAYNLNN